MAAVTSLQQQNSKALDSSSVLQFPHWHLNSEELNEGKDVQLQQFISLTGVYDKP